jgi:glycosyltransferase involved in cell wall biosynthesis
MLRVVAVSGFPPDPYGEAHYAGEVYSALARLFPQEIELFVLAHKNPNAPNNIQVLPNLYIQRINDPKSRNRHLTALHLLRTIKMLRPNVVHFQGTHTKLWGGIIGEPITMLMLVLRAMKIPVMITLHSIWMPEDFEYLWEEKWLRGLSQVLKWDYRVNIKLIGKAAKLINILSAADHSPMVYKFQQAYRLDPTRVHNEAHGCTYAPTSETAQKKAKAKLGLEGCRIVLAVGFVRPDKGYHVLLDAADPLLRQFSDVVIVIAGEPHGRYGASYASLLQNKRRLLRTRDRVVLELRYLSEEELSIYFDAADIVVLPYLRVVGASGPLHRALGCGKPVVATALGHNLGLHEVCKLVSPNDSEQLVVALASLLKSWDEYMLYRQKSIEYASRHTWEDVARQYRNQYLQILEF